MALKNKWVGYIHRGYLDIKNSILDRVRISVPQLTDFSESNIFVIIISIFGGLVEQINYYIDQLMRESFLVTARRFTSVVRHSRMFDYRIKAANPASTDLTLNFLVAGQPYSLLIGQQETIPAGTVFTSDNGLVFRSTKLVQVNHPHKKAIVPVLQYENKTELFTIASSDPDQKYAIGTNYVDNTMSLIINVEPWTRVPTFALSRSWDKHYIIDIGFDGIAYLQFGDGVRGEIPPFEGNAEMFYQVTAGPVGNVEPGSITSEPNINWNHIDSVEVINYNTASGGTNYEGIERIRRNVPLSLRTLQRAVTRKDYVDVALLHPGVNKSYLFFECGKFVDIYISPVGGGIAQQPLLDDVKDWFEDYRMVTTFVDVKSAGESKLVLDLHVVGRFRMKAQAIEEQVTQALLEEYGYENSDINRAVRKSDVYALVDNQTAVDYLLIQKMYLIPFLFPFNHNTPFNMEFEMISDTEILNYQMIYLGGNQFQIQREFVFEGNASMNTEYNNGIFKLTPLAGGYLAGMVWNFKVYPPGSDIVISDNSIPVLTSDNLTLTIKEVISQ